MSDQLGYGTPVLVVDDDATTRIALEALLVENGYSVVCAEDAEKAYKLYDEHNFRIIISDWEMPGMSGIDLCEAVRESHKQGYTYFILLTSHSEHDRIIRGLEAGADDFMAKPYSPAELRVRLQTAHRISTIDTMDMTIFALARLAESRDPETGLHLERVRQYTRLLATELKQTGCSREIDNEFVNLIYATSPLHDIGKVSIPDCVLLKPGQLNDHEFEIMKTHTTRGAETINAALDRYPNQRFLKLAYQITRSHHERFDGTGYPDGLAGEDIPISARIMSLADVYDALTSKRVYKEAFAHHVASQIIRDGAGTQFDPKVVLAFERLEESFERICEFYASPSSSAAA